MGRIVTAISKRTMAGPVALALMIGMLRSVELSSPAPAAAAVEVAPGAAAEKDRAVMKELVMAFDQAEAAVRKGEVEALMPFYAKAYNYHGLKRADVRRVWEEVFRHYRGLSSRHVFTQFKLEQAGGTKKAFVTCTGGLYGTDKDTGKPVTIDSWVSEVHHLIYEHGAWRFFGNAGTAPESSPAGSAPHHPLF